MKKRKIHLIDGQVDASVRDDAEQVGQVAPAEDGRSFPVVNFSRRINDPFVLASRSQR